MTSLFHAAPIRLAPGSVILPGNWGRIIQAAGEQHPHWAAEQIFEKARAERFPRLPSRLKACFACTSEQALRFFVRTGFRNNPVPPVLYRVEKLEPAAAEHRADFNLIATNHPHETIEGQALRYWEGAFRYTISDAPGIVCEEMITASPLRIVDPL